MAVGIIDGDDRAAFYCTTEMRAFGPAFDSTDEAVDFKQWLTGDPRDLANDGSLRPVFDEWKQTVREDD